ncbi:MAG: cohesin domain-containing protein [Inhella sp.]
MSMWKVFKRGLCALAGAAWLSSSAWAADPVLSSTSSPNPAAPGGSVAVTINISNIADLFAYPCALSFDATLLQLSSVSAGSFLSGAGSTVFDGGVVDNGAGSLSFVYESLLGPVSGASGSGSLAVLYFDVLGAGSSALWFSDAVFLDSALADITVQALPGSVTAVPEPSALLMMCLGLTGLLLVRRRAA